MFYEEPFKEKYLQVFLKRIKLSPNVRLQGIATFKTILLGVYYRTIFFVKH